MYVGTTDEGVVDTLCMCGLQMRGWLIHCACVDYR